MAVLPYGNSGHERVNAPTPDNINAYCANFLQNFLNSRYYFIIIIIIVIEIVHVA